MFSPLCGHGVVFDALAAQALTLKLSQTEETSNETSLGLTDETYAVARRPAGSRAVLRDGARASPASSRSG